MLLRMPRTVRAGHVLLDAKRCRRAREDLIKLVARERILRPDAREREGGYEVDAH